MALLNPLTAGLLYMAFATVPATVTVISWRNRDSPGATALVVTGASASAATVIQGLRFVEQAVGAGEPVALVLLYETGEEGTTVRLRLPVGDSA